jgi:hypothetical protein
MAYCGPLRAPDTLYFFHDVRNENGRLLHNRACASAARAAAFLNVRFRQAMRLSMRLLDHKN